MSTKLEALYQRMSEITEPKCRNSCRIPLSCCAAEYCTISIEWAKDKYGIVLQTTEHPTLPLMGKAGCTALPHLRPFCTRHVCSINSINFDKDTSFNEEYFYLYDEISKLEN